MMKTSRLICLALTVCLTLTLCLQGRLQAAALRMKAGNSFDSLMDEERTLSPEYYTAEDIYENGDKREAYELWLKLAFEGDIYALTNLAVITQADPDLDWPVPASFWEKWSIKLLGEGEGNFLLGLHHAAMPGAMSQSLAEQYFVRSAMTGHTEGMYAAAYTGGDRSGTFKAPAKPAVAVIPENIAPFCTEEQRYWVSRAAGAGHSKSAAMAGNWYLRAETPESRGQALHYFTIAANNGNYHSALTLSTEYARNAHAEKRELMRCLTYSGLCVRMEMSGVLPEDMADEVFSAIIQKYSPQTPKPYYTRPELAQALENSQKLYEAWTKKQDQSRSDRKKLYDNAAKNIKKVKTDYEKALKKPR